MRVLISLWGLCMFLSAQLLAQPHPNERYWIFLGEKSPLDQFQAQALFSEKALDRRARQQVWLDHYDLPIEAEYLAQLASLGIKPYRQSRWLNAISTPLNPEQFEIILSLPFVKGIKPVAVGQRVSDIPQTLGATADSAYPAEQIEQMNLHLLHESGFQGQGVLIGVFDNGYQAVDDLAAFSHLYPEENSSGRTHIMATQDYVDRDESLYHSCIHCRHGTYVFSILAGLNDSLGFTGSAPFADFILMRTEDDFSETHCEEDNWIAAAEFADSMGAQIFTTSLGYYSFDQDSQAAIICPPGQDFAYSLNRYRFEDLDGRTPLITRAADIAASRGILVVNSAGNRGVNGLVAPADGDSVLAIGAVDRLRIKAGFSSLGPTADGRIKPDLSALGRQTYYYHPNGQLRQGSGTSFSCPLVSGLIGCLLQIHPNAQWGDVVSALKQSASQSTTPDNLLGYGIPDAVVASRLLREMTDPKGFSAGPTVNDGHFWVNIPSELAGDEASFLEVLDLSGRSYPLHVQKNGTVWEAQLTGSYTPGYYIVRLQHPQTNTKRMYSKLILR